MEGDNAGAVERERRAETSASGERLGAELAQTGPPDARTESAVRSVQRAARMLKCFTRDRPELGVTELSRELGLSKSTVSRLLAALREEGFVAQVAETGKYRLGLAIARLGSVLAETLDLTSVADPTMRALARETGETVSLVVCDVEDCVVIHSVPSSGAIRVVHTLGTRQPYRGSAAGEVVRAFADARIVDGLAASASEAAGGADFVDASETAAGCSRDGYVIVRDGWLPDVVEIAAPVHDQGVLRAVLVLSAPAYRFDAAEAMAAAAAVREAAKLVSCRLGPR